MVVTESDRVTLLNSLHSSNAFASILLTPSAIVTLVIDDNNPATLVMEDMIDRVICERALSTNDRNCIICWEVTICCDCIYGKVLKETENTEVSCDCQRAKYRLFCYCSLVQGRLPDKLNLHMIPHVRLLRACRNHRINDMIQRNYVYHISYFVVLC